MLVSRFLYMKMRIRRTAEWAWLGWKGEPLVEAIAPGCVLQGFKIRGHVYVPPWFMCQEPAPILQNNFIASPDKFPRTSNNDVTGLHFGRPLNAQEMGQYMREARMN